MTNGVQFTVIKATGKREVFEPEKLRSSLMRSGADTESVESVMQNILESLHNDMPTAEIYSKAFRLLHEHEKPVAYRYSIRRALLDLGPSGFPFEDFVAEILKAKGYQTLTRQNVLGGCVPHEIDVVAWNDKKLLMAEAKFHNELGSKSDLKVALYVKARFDDLKENVYNYGGMNRPVNESWLITNTKFSSTAIHYGVCMNLTMIGWNYPEKGNLQDMIVEEHLHPLTCLSSLTSVEKKEILTSGTVLCSSLVENPVILETVLGKDRVEKVLQEISEL
ncbi:ATPase [Candidatus Parcubacteria bacterium]|nr:ATPase [Candidatus Parcubacteria bacterium]